MILIDLIYNLALLVALSVVSGFVDIVMPGMNGRELWKRVAALKPGLRCLFTSGYTANVIAHQGILEAEIHFLQKPFTSDILARKIREVLES